VLLLVVVVPRARTVSGQLDGTRTWQVAKKVRSSLTTNIYMHKPLEEEESLVKVKRHLVHVGLYMILPFPIVYAVWHLVGGTTRMITARSQKL